MKKLIQRILNKVPKQMKNVWWHQAIWNSENHRFPIVKWEEIGYLDCKVGLVVPMLKLKNGNYAYYEITKKYSKGGSDWIYDGDKWNCDMVFHSIRKGLGVGGYEKKEGIQFITHNL